MKKLTFGLLAVLSLAIFNACGPTPEQAVEYNDAIIDQQKAVVESFNELYDVIGSYEADEMDEAYANTTAVLDGAIKKIEGMDDFDGSSSFKDAALEYFNVYKDLLQNEYQQVIQLFKLPDEDFTEVEEEMVNDIDESIWEKGEEAFNKFVKVQKEFAEKYNFQLV